MQRIKHYWMFLQIYSKQNKRKWFTFPLILLSPLIIIAAILWMMVNLLQVENIEPIKIAIVNQDDAEETEMLINMLAETEEMFASYIAMEVLEEAEAEEEILANELSAYIVFPERFIEDLFIGKQVTLPVVGNVNKKMDSMIVKEIVDSVMRHINTSQANILLINRYAKEMMEDDEARNDYLFEQFLSFFLFALGKDSIITTDEAENIATTSLSKYYSLSAIFILTTVWLWLIYLFIHRDEAARLEERIRLYGVTTLQQLLAKMTLVFVIHSVLSIALWIAFIQSTKAIFELEDYGRLFMVFLLYTITLLVILAIIELITSSLKSRLLLQLVVIILLVICSGAIVPVIYFPLYIQDKLSFIFSYEALYWLQEIILRDRLFVSYRSLIQFTGIGLLALFTIALIKERRQL
ncbi:MAG TPA: ABC transporter permease [Pseudogracilibacillus sp.]|nr:ABC transporter permease [Pseudogracilibacillus sp.]